MNSKWQSVLTLDAGRQRVDGSETALADAIRRGADLRIYTEFLHNEHIETGSSNDELVKEVSEFRVTYLVDDRWVAGIMTLRQPILPPAGFGPRPSMSFFMYNQDGQQAIARPLLDGTPAEGKKGPSPIVDIDDMPKFHQLENWDEDTNAPSQNFVYDFEQYRYCVRDDWHELLHHDDQGNVLSGTFKELMIAFEQGCETKVAIQGLSGDLGESMNHEVIVQTGPGYFNTGQNLFSAGTHPVVRVCPAIPMRYLSNAWDFGWLMVRTDGFVARLLVDPYTLAFSKSEARHTMRWFAR